MFPGSTAGDSRRTQMGATPAGDKGFRVERQSEGGALTAIKTVCGERYQSLDTGWPLNVERHTLKLLIRH